MKHVLVPVQKYWEWTHVHLSDIVGSKHEPTVRAKMKLVYLEKTCQLRLKLAESDDSLTHNLDFNKAEECAKAYTIN